MTEPGQPRTYPAASTGLLLVDPYNDFLSEGGKLNGRAKPVADQVGTLANLKRTVTIVRATDNQVFYVPHHRARSGDFRGAGGRSRRPRRALESEGVEVPAAQAHAAFMAALRFAYARVISTREWLGEQHPR